MSSFESRWSRSTKTVKKYSHKASKAVMRSYHFRIPVYDMPLRLRPWFLLFTILVMIILAFLGFTNFSHSLPLNDKLLHFFCLMFATGVFYFIFDVEEDARRVWFWRESPLIFTGVFCFFFGGIISEFVQSMLPYKEFQFGDVIANLLGSSIGLYIAYYLERYYRSRREISRLYRPLDTDYLSSDDEDDLEAGVQLLPTNTALRASNNTSKSVPKATRLADVWDEREELFDIGDESDDEDVARPGPVPSGPKIVVTSLD
ncbi:hypothetical protein QCA50_003964 [Cerrena zonata]|uniref:VanZ-like domain-containing protein n=1 Tax=Cerrena zonata TaxID=2478898 RepID=A0AAW0GKK9_9APHY